MLNNLQPSASRATSLFSGETHQAHQDTARAYEAVSVLENDIGENAASCPLPSPGGSSPDGIVPIASRQ